MVSTDRKAFDERSAVRQRLREYAHALETHRHKGSELHVIVFSTKRHGFAAVAEENLFLYPTSACHRLLYLLGAYRIGKKIKGVSVVSTQDPFETGLVGWRLARYHRARFQAQIHTDFLSPYFASLSMLNRLRVFIGTILLPKTNSIRVVSKRIVDSLRPLRLKAPVHVLPIFTDLKKLWEEEGSDLKKMYPQFRKHVLVAARLEKEKGIALAIDVIALQPKGVGLCIAGDGSDRAHLEFRAKNLGISDRVVFMGWRENLGGLYKSADALLFTSAYDGYGLALVEAAALGCPFVSTDVGVARELYNLGARSAIVAGRSINEFADALRETIKDGRATAGDFVLGLTGFAATKKEYLKRYIDLLTN